MPVEQTWKALSSRLLACAVLAALPMLAHAAEDDPWEGVNRSIFTFNDTLDTYALKPAAQGYQYVTPQFLEDGIEFFGKIFKHKPPC